MERATRERLTGAVILVAALAILVPEMLLRPGGDGRSVANADALADTGPPLTTYELPLNPASAAPAVLNPQLASEPVEEAARPQVTEAPGADSPMPQASATASDEARADAATAPPAAVVTPTRPASGASSASSASRVPTTPTAPKPPTATSATPPPTAATTPATAGAWWVQLGSFASEQNAQSLARKLRERGFSIEVSKVRSGGRDLYRVRAGPEKNRDTATALRSKLAAAGEQGALVAP